MPEFAAICGKFRETCEKTGRFLNKSNEEPGSKLLDIFVWQGIGWYGMVHSQPGQRHLLFFSQVMGAFLRGMQKHETHGRSASRRDATISLRPFGRAVILPRKIAASPLRERRAQV
jgi:hypothetical protein